MLERVDNLTIIKQLFGSLTSKEKESFREYLSSVKDAFLPVDINREITSCPHCGSTHYVKNGTKDGRQRYLCKFCKKTFSSSTGTILFHSKKDIETWSKYIHCLVEKYPLRRCAKECGITLHTAFIWRHKILDCLSSSQKDVRLSGIIEADETFTPISYKGNHKQSKNFKMPRLAHRRGTKASKRGISNEKVCIACGVNLDCVAIAQIANLGKPSIDSLSKVFADRINKNSVFVTDSLSSYNQLSEKLNLTHISIPRFKRHSGTFNIQLVNNYHARLKGLIHYCFHGVATKYLNNYIIYHNIVNFKKSSIEATEQMINKLTRNTKFNILFSAVQDRPAIPL